MTEYGWTRTGTVVHLVDNPFLGMPSRARCGVEVDEILKTNMPPKQFLSEAICANCAAALPLARFKASRP